MKQRKPFSVEISEDKPLTLEGLRKLVEHLEESGIPADAKIRGRLDFAASDSEPGDYWLYIMYDESINN